MSEWRDRGYVLDSDEEDLTPSSPTTPSSSQNQPPQNPPTKPPAPDRRGRPVSPDRVSLQNDVQNVFSARDEQQDVVMQDLGPYQGNQREPSNSAGLGDLLVHERGGQTRDAELGEDRASSASHGTTIPGPPTSYNQQAIVLITQSRTSPSPDVPPAKAARTYSRKFNPSTARQAASNVSRHTPPAAITPVADGTLNNIDTEPVNADLTIAEQGAESGRTHPPSEPMPTPVPQERRSSVSSSDLSDVDMEVLSASPHRYFPHGLHPQQTNGAAQLGTHLRPLSITPGASNGPLSTQHMAALGAPLRSFRTRRAIQLHPYAIESEQYRQALKARGYRPVQVVTASQQPQERQETQDAEYQTRVSQTQSQSAMQTQETTPPDSSASSGPAQRHRMLELTANDQEEFPDVNAILRRDVIGSVRQGFKRRKTLETPHNDRLLRPGSSSTSSARGKLRSLNLSRRQSAPGNHELLPPSPPRTSSPPNIDPISAAPRFRLPRGLTPSAVPTPLPSSPERATLASARRQRHILESSDHDGVYAIDDASAESSSSESDVDERQLMRMRRRIKGVLPASWLKLDKQARRPSPTQESRNTLFGAPAPTAPTRGVAQRKDTSTSATPARPERIVISDNSDGSDSSVDMLPVPLTRQTRLSTPVVGQSLTFDDGPGEVEEHDEIDAMLPSTSRMRTTKGSSRKRQSRLTDVSALQPVHVQETQPAQARRIAGPSTTHTSRPRKKATSKRKSGPKRPVQLSILDATTETNAQLKPRPQFVRLAARQARHRPDHGRHSPTNKAIRLATREDTQEALEPLMSWNSGGLHQTWDSSADQRRSHARSYPGSADRGSGKRAAAADPTSSRPIPPTRSTHGGDSHRATLNHQRGHRAALSYQAQSRRILERNYRMRPAQLEAVTGNASRNLDPLTFAAPPSRLMEIFNRDGAGVSSSRFRLERFLRDRLDLPEADAAPQTEAGPPVASTAPAANDESAVARKPRKRLARRVDVERVEFRQPDEPLPIYLPSAPEEAISATTVDTKVLQGLGPFGTRYPTDFDVRPLEIGTYFASTTFVGSGDFDDCLQLRNRDLDLPAGHITIEVGGQSFYWSAWDEDVSSGLTTILKACADDLRCVEEAQHEVERRTMMKDSIARFDYLLRSLVRYLSGCLHFLDPIDRPSCLNRLSRFREEFTAMIEEGAVKLKTFPDVSNQTDTLLTSSLIFVLCLTAQSVRIARYPASDSKTITSLMDQTVTLSRKILMLALPERFTAIRTFLEEQRQHAKRDSGIQEDNVAIKSIVVINHVLRSVDASTALSDIVTAQLTHDVRSTCNIHVLDQVWYDAVLIQPLLEIDSGGIFRPGKRFMLANDNWKLIKCLLERTFDLYPATSQTRNASLNEYVRACLVRVNHLIVRWGWRRCETVLGVIYDFFARNNLSQLYKEEGKGSPKFLEDIDQDPVIEVDARDCAFHIFLKLLVVGLRGMQDIYPENKVRGFAWRFIPNHGRTYRKDQEMTRVALDALRNHHDLLCTLYWVLPPGSGPRLQMIMDLVDHTNSHREACRLSVHAWGILARYQLSQEEQSADRDALASWFREMVTVTISQYRLARSEAESQYSIERARGSTEISSEMLEATIASNQRSIFATLVDLIQALRQAIRASKTWVAAHDLAESSRVLDVFKLFDTDQTRLYAAILQTLNVVDELLAVRASTNGHSQRESQNGSEDSQEYGDWSFMEQVVEPERGPKVSEIAFLQDPLANLLSTCFGSERSPDDELLKKTVATWTAVAHEYVKDGIYDWSTFLDVYSTLSWFQLRDTDQRHKYTAYFLSCVLEADKMALKDHRNLFLRAWLVSLLDRESVLKFQNRLTASLLENATQEPLLDNLPFAPDSRTGHYDITLSDLRERRVSLIGCILFNMRASLERTPYSRPSAASELRRDYADMLKQAMQYMRKTYEELQDMSGRLGTSHHVVRGAYVTFVQQIISLMQQYTSDICHIDNFFVDSSAFPLPANDPTYVVGRLKSYVSKLSDPKARKQLSVFIQTVGERAALDNQQPYLVDQLKQALIGKTSRALRRVFMTAILPAYISGASSDACGWILAMPLISAATLVTADLIYEVNICDEKALAVDIESITALLRVLHDWTLTASENLGSLVTTTSNLHILAAVFDVVSSSLTIVDYVYRSTGKANIAATLIRSFMTLGDFLSTVLNEPDDLDTVIPPDVSPSVNSGPTNCSDTLEFSSRGLLEDLNRAWAFRGDGYYVARGNNVREVVVNIGLVEEETAKAKDAIGRARKDYKAVFEFGSDPDPDELDLQRLADLWV